MYPRNSFGHRTEVFEYHPSVGWTGADVWWARVAGQRLEMGGSTSYLAHVDAVGSMVMETDQTGAVTYDIRYYPWGQLWLTSGSRPSQLFAGLEWQLNDPVIPSATREYNDGLGRWMTPDPGGRKVVKLDNPQTWNMYAYVTDNPTTLNDPSGLAHDPCSGKAADVCTELPQSKAARARAIEAGEAGLNFTIAAAKIKFAAGLSTTSETGVGAFAAFYTGWSAAGNIAAGSFQLAGALTGKTKVTEEAAEGASAATSALGVYTLVKTGSLDKAAGAAAFEGIVTARPGDLTEGGTATRVAKAIDLLQNIHRVEQKVENWF